ncbi:ABC transporter substrate-binding protein [Anaerobacillus alkaliphilus]|uniref:ABC transporter substrate-binding protein n=1 Tax=Anaerobacillus alkaliphilus TaxID=1548597 RepID=A0A4Q0VQU6_9BACI|nr:ABC transporter substrate-binding protein [Anaerobacillus alkaliphilus]
MKFWKLATLAFALVFFMTACSSDKTDTKEDSYSETEHGEIVPSITILSSTPEANQTQYEAANMAAAEWRKLGIDVTVRPIEFNTMVDRVFNGEDHDFDVYTIGWSGRAERLDPDMFTYSILHSSNAGPGGNNSSGFVHAAFDELASAQRQEMDIDKRREMIFQTQEIIADEVPFVTTYVPMFVQAYNNERFTDVPLMVGEGIFSEWLPYYVKPLADDKVLRVGSTYDLNTLNPLDASTAYEWRILRLIYDKLVRVSLEGAPTPAAASGWDVIDDTTVDVFVREGMTFHDGNPVTAEDVKFSFDFQIEHNPGYFLAFIDPIESVEVVNDTTVRFNLKYPYAPFVNNTLAQIPIIPKHYWENVMEEQGISSPADFPNLDPIGSGPMTFNHWRRGEEISLSTNNDFYHNIEISGMIYRLYGQMEGIMAGLQRKDIDTLSDPMIPAHINQSRGIEHLNVTETGSIGFQFLGFNLRRVPFDNKEFRNALAHTIDFHTIVDAHLEGYGGLGGAGLNINDANQFWHNPNVTRPAFEPSKAREILEAAGYTWDSQGRLRLPAN